MSHQIKEENDPILSMKRTGRNYDKRFIRKIVSLVESGYARRSINVTYGVSLKTLEAWMLQYGSDSYREQKRSIFSKLQKRTIVTAITQGRMSFEEAKVAYNVKSVLLIKEWVRKFREEENVDICQMKPVAMTKSSNPADADAVAALQEALKEAEMKIKALNTMIDIAEERLKIDIRKKSGAKQSRD